MRWIYTILVLLHAFLAFVKWHATYIGGFFWDKMVIFIIFICYLACYFMANWIYNKPDYTDGVPTLRQQKFELWLWFEIMMFISYIVGGAVYILIYKVK